MNKTDALNGCFILFSYILCVDIMYALSCLKTKVQKSLCKKLMKDDKMIHGWREKYHVDTTIQ